MGLSKEIVDLASRQGGYITRTQILETGLSISTIDRRVAAGELTVVSEGIYQVFASSDHTDLMRGAVLALPTPVVSHQSAAHLLEFPQLPELVPTVTVARHTTHRFPGVMVRRSEDLDKSHLTRVEGLPVTNVLRTAFDLAGSLRFDEFDSIGEALILAGRMRLRHFERLTNDLARRGKPGSRAAKEFIAIRLGGDPRATALERKGRAILASAGLPSPVAQYPIPWDHNLRFDDAYPEVRLAIEWDSRAWHLQTTAMEADRRRDREAAVHGWHVIRFTWRDIADHPEQVSTTVGTLLQERRAS